MAQSIRTFDALSDHLYPGLPKKVPYTRPLKQERLSYTSKSWVLEIKELTGWVPSESLKKELDSGFFFLSLSLRSRGVLVCVSVCKFPFYKCGTQSRRDTTFKYFI